MEAAVSVWLKLWWYLGKEQKPSHPLKQRFLRLCFNIVISLFLFGHRISRTVFSCHIAALLPKEPGLVWFGLVERDVSFTI